MPIRPVRLSDTPQLLKIYSAYIPTSVTFEEVLPTEDVFAARITDFTRRFPYLVWEEDGVVLAYAYAHPYGERAAYRWSAELSVYVAKEARGRGIGLRLYGALLDILRMQGVHTAYGCIALPNDPSVAFHKALGFECVAVFPRIGYKLGAWHDTAWYGLKLFFGENAPEELLAKCEFFNDIDPAFLSVYEAMWMEVKNTK